MMIVTNPIPMPKISICISTWRRAAILSRIVTQGETTSAKFGSLKWKGWVRGEKLDATALLAQDGKAPIENWVAAGLKR